MVGRWAAAARDKMQYLFFSFEDATGGTRQKICRLPSCCASRRAHKFLPRASPVPHGTVQNQGAKTDPKNRPGACASDC